MNEETQIQKQHKDQHIMITNLKLNPSKLTSWSYFHQMDIWGLPKTKIFNSSSPIRLNYLSKILLYMLLKKDLIVCIYIYISAISHSYKTSPKSNMDYRKHSLFLPCDWSLNQPKLKTRSTKCNFHFRTQSNKSIKKKYHTEIGNFKIKTGNRLLNTTNLQSNLWISTSLQKKKNLTGNQPIIS